MTSKLRKTIKNLQAKGHEDMQYTKINNFIYRWYKIKDLNISIKSTYLELMKMAHDGNKNKRFLGWIFLSQKEIAEFLDIDTAALSRIIKKLEEEGLIKTTFYNHEKRIFVNFCEILLKGQLPSEKEVEELLNKYKEELYDKNNKIKFPLEYDFDDDDEKEQELDLSEKDVYKSDEDDLIKILSDFKINKKIINYWIEKDSKNNLINIKNVLVYTIRQKPRNYGKYIMSLIKNNNIGQSGEWFKIKENADEIIKDEDDDDDDDLLW